MSFCFVCRQEIGDILHADFVKNSEGDLSAVRVFLLSSGKTGPENAQGIRRHRLAGELPRSSFDKLAKRLQAAICKGDGDYAIFFDEDVDFISQVGPLFNIDVLWSHFIRLYRVPPEDLKPGAWDEEKIQLTDDHCGAPSGGALSPGADLPFLPPAVREVKRKQPNKRRIESDDEDQSQEPELNDQKQHTDRKRKNEGATGLSAIDLTVSSNQRLSLLRQHEHKAQFELSDFGIGSEFTIALPNGSAVALDTDAVAPLDGNSLLHDRCADALVCKNVLQSGLPSVAYNRPPPPVCYFYRGA